MGQFNTKNENSTLDKALSILASTTNEDAIKIATAIKEGRLSFLDLLIHS